MHLACENVTVSYQRHPAIHHLSCIFKMGTTTAIVGPNGAGKSTLVKAILGELNLDTGKIMLQGINREDIAYLPQINEIDNSLPLTVTDVVLLGSWYKIGILNKPDILTNQAVNSCLAEVGLSGFNNRYVNELSKGQLQRVLLARVIMQQSQIIILDEPFNALDNKTIIDLLKLIKKWQAEGKTIIAVLHDLNQVASGFEYTMLLAKELIMYDKTSVVLREENLRQAYSNSFVWIESELCQS